MASQVGIFRDKYRRAMMAAIDDLPSFHGELTALGACHVGYGVKPRHYEAVGEVLIGTFAEMAGDTFDAETRAAWSILYDDMTRIMLEGRQTGRNFCCAVGAPATTRLSPYGEGGKYHHSSCRVPGRARRLHASDRADQSRPPVMGQYPGHRSAVREFWPVTMDLQPRVSSANAATAPVSFIGPVVSYRQNELPTDAGGYLYAYIDGERLPRGIHEDRFFQQVGYRIGALGRIGIRGQTRL
ncbi:globin domain-containing protein [Sphingomonas sp. MMS24-JH45]